MRFLNTIFQKKIYSRKSNMNLPKDMTKRNDIFNKLSEEIVEKYGGILTEVFHHASKTDLDIKWYNMDFHQNNGRLLVAIGSISHKVGDIVSNEKNEQTYIDESNINNYLKPMKLVLPVKFVNSGDIESAVTFIEEYSILMYKLYPEDIETFIGDNDFLNLVFSAFGGTPNNIETLDKELEKYNKQMSPPPIKTPDEKEPEVVQGFDVSELDLDEAQIQQLMLMKDDVKI